VTAEVQFDRRPDGDAGASVGMDYDPWEHDLDVLDAVRLLAWVRGTTWHWSGCHRSSGGCAPRAKVAVVWLSTLQSAEECAALA
jgi:hypothetical protein